MNFLPVAVSVALATVQVATDESGVQPTDTTAAEIVADCNARKFETSVEIEKDGQKRLTRLKLCAAREGDQASWVRTLEDAKEKIAAHPDISEESKAKIAAELDAEIAKNKSGPGATHSMPVDPPIPAPQQPKQAVLPPPQSAPPTYATTVASPAQSLARPHLAIRCLDAGDDGEGSSCMVLERNTRLYIRAEGDIGTGTSLRFLRRGDMRGEVTLTALRQGQIVRARLPERLCVGVSSSKVEIQVVRSNKVIETLGPYPLRC